MFISARAEYACLAMMELASRYGAQKPVPLDAVIEKHGIPKRFVVLILLQMKAAGLVKTVRGPTGGYTLAKSPNQISLNDIFIALEQSEPGNERWGRDSTFAPSLHKVWNRLNEVRTKVLREVVLSELLPQTMVDYVI